MLKKWIALVVCAALSAGLGLYALADPASPVFPAASGSEKDGADVRLARITQSVKNTLGLDTERYTDFQGNVSEEELGNVWYLNWTGESENLNVEALEDGTVVSYWFNDNRDEYTYTNGLPAFPNVDAAAARAAAEQFLKKVLNPKTETVRLEDPEAGQLRSTAVRFSGRILLNGLESPLNYSLTVRGSDNVVTNFNRGAPARSFLGAIPDPAPAVEQDTAADALKGVTELELIYVLPDADSGTAVLRYVPKGDKTLAVDAQTGEIVDVTESFSIYTNSARAYGAPEAEEAAKDMGLTAVELAGVEKLSGVLDRAILDRRVRSESAYMLEAYTLQSAAYRLVKEKNDSGTEVERVLCTLRYTTGEETEYPLTDTVKTVHRYDRTFTVDARTGAVRSLYSSEGWNQREKGEAPAVSATQAQETALAYLSRLFQSAQGPDTAKLSLYDTEDKTADGAASYAFTYARQENGVFFPTDSCTVRVDCTIGAVSGLDYTWHGWIAFDGTEGVVSPETALNAWVSTYDVRLAYRLLPKELDPAVEAEARLIATGMTKFYALFLSYGLERDTDSPYRSCPGVDAKTGQPVEPVSGEPDEITYSDIADSPARSDIERLASFGIGYAGGAFRPGRTLTQWDLVCLLVSSQGWRLNPETAEESERENVYQAAYRMGILTRDQRNDRGTVNRGALVKYLLNSAGYKSVAALEGIFTCAYTDSASIPAGDIGYAALAQALHMAEGTYGAKSAATRADAAVMLCRLMERES